MAKLGAYTNAKAPACADGAKSRMGDAPTAAPMPMPKRRPNPPKATFKKSADTFGKYTK